MALLKNLFPRMGLPQVIPSDRGPQFIAQFWKYLWKKLQTKVALRGSRDNDVARGEFVALLPRVATLVLCSCLSFLTN
jgi:hypothetical protein